MLRRICKWLQRRNHNPRDFLFDILPAHSVCAEVGVWKGEFSERILQKSEPEMLHLIDPWEFQPSFPNRMYGGKKAASQDDMDAIFSRVQQKIGIQDNVNIVRKKSHEAAKVLPERSLDWVYIDGNHFYEYVKQDLKYYYTIVKEGGYIAGDDYDWGPNFDFPVRSAIHEFICLKSYNVEIVTVKNGQFVLRKV